ncbi:MAG TPA: hypothetical protein EYN66_22305 [Myxococcales bacterium]|nr:hypothetical protein [Myxococcales bacterium]
MTLVRIRFLASLSIAFALPYGCATTQSNDQPESLADAETTFEGVVSDIPMAHLIRVPPNHRIIYVDNAKRGQIVVYVHNDANLECPGTSNGSKATIRFYGRFVTLSGRGKRGQRIHTEEQLISSHHKCL